MNPSKVILLPKSLLPFDSLAEVAATEAQQHYADIAASIQLVFEETVLGLCRKLHRETGLDNICYAGGAALNCVTNSKIQQATPFVDLYVPPDPGDGGAAAGAALYGYATLGGARKTHPVDSPYLGKSYDETLDREMLNHVNPDLWIRHREIGPVQKKGLSLKVEKNADLSDYLPSVVDDLVAGKIVGWFQGKFENGPRALGNRSILIDPSNLEAASRLSKQVKLRAPYRPYAVSIASESATKVLGGPIHRVSKWMQTTAPIHNHSREKVAAACHIDGTTRPQVCQSHDNPEFHQLLTAFGAITGTAALLNTSFNDSGFPIVSSPLDAIVMFARTEMDTLVINNTVIRKERK